MHGSYQLREMRDGVHVYARSTDLDALIDSFPALTFVDPDPRSTREKLAVASLGASASVLLLALGSSSQMDIKREAPAQKAAPEAEATLDSQAAPTVPASTEVSVASAVERVAPVSPPEAPSPAPPPLPVAQTTSQVEPEPTAAVDAQPQPVDPKPTVASDSQPRPELLLSEEAVLSEADALLAPPESASTNQGGKTHLIARVDGNEAGQLSFSDSGQTISLQLGSVLALLADRFPPEEFERLAGSPAAAQYVPVDMLAAAGLAISYDPVYDEILLDTSTSVPAEAGQSQVPSEYS
ncbi:hypothetical protein P8Q88_09040 [Qipengyuania sp. XHP0207]|uniref:hypothetical protein n=1 Tax=Qipengyuania sp. XHP0207 TaxID=3038078 RepID=UPI00241E8DE4|nr:hypothetical protein [Qipengyuania sp. XHP0207]MDG5748327.1 hypothetical protein [Qipengyuania sp. XHP0207]